jgi:hypothetical protein
MTEHDLLPDDAAGGSSVDLRRLAEDDRLLDLLAAGDEPDDGGDQVSALLAGWRADVVSDMPTVRRASPPLPASAPPARRSSRSARPARRMRSAVVVAVAAAAVVGVGGTVAAASGARPGSPLWPITRVIYPDRANSVVAEQDAREAIDQAQKAIDAENYEDAQRLLDQATDRVDEVSDPAVAQVLRDEIAAVRGLLTGLLGGQSPSPSSTSSGGTGGTGTGAQPTGQPTLSQSSASKQPCIVPTGILPTGLLPPVILPSGLIC